MCEKCKKQKKLKDKCVKCRSNDKMRKTKLTKGKVATYVLAARKPGVNVLGKYVH